MSEGSYTSSAKTENNNKKYLEDYNQFIGYIVK